MPAKLVVRPTSASVAASDITKMFPMVSSLGVRLYITIMKTFSRRIEIPITAYVMDSHVGAVQLSVTTGLVTFISTRRDPHISCC